MLPLWTSEETEQAAFLHQLSDDVVRGGGRAGSKQRDEVAMAETLQDLNFPLKFSVVQLRVWEEEGKERDTRDGNQGSHIEVLTI